MSDTIINKKKFRDIQKIIKLEFNRRRSIQCTYTQGR